MLNKGVWLFGAGEWGRKYIEEYGNSLCRGFIDNSSEKQSSKIGNSRVYSYDEFKELFNFKNDSIIITTASGRDEVILQLFSDKLHLYAKAYVPGRGVVEIKDSWNRIANSQLGEDIGLMHWFECKGLLKGYKGFYLDIGAYHPFAYSNTRWAYELGWRGINIDPNENSIKMFNIFRPDDININCGVSDKNAELTYHIFKGAEGKNSFIEEDEKTHIATSSKLIKVYNINEILEKYHIENIDFVDIDTEGFDEKIVYAFDWKRYHPKCVLIEFLEQESVEEVIQSSVHKKMKEEGYFLYSFYTITALYVKRDAN